jgi:hypothetical protein
VHDAEPTTHATTSAMIVNKALRAKERVEGENSMLGAPGRAMVGAG